MTSLDPAPRYDDPADRYDTDIDLGNENTSHTQIVGLVGRDKRVLDVGCATGYLAAVLRERGCTVSGLEYEPAAAEKARPHLDRLVVGSVDEVDLEAEFGTGGFDAVVYGDVLEHLPDPVATLRRTLPLLAEGGAVVASIPHVAHGAVRLALLDGRFEYTETGLLDDTHVRFFTADRVLETFADAGLAVVAMSRTTADLTGTEIPVDLSAYDAAVLERVRADPESTTYQFVVRAVRADEADPAAVAAVAAAERDRRRQHRLARTSSEAAPAQERVPASAAGEVGVWGAFDLDDLGQAVLLRTHRTELERRLPGVRVRSWAPYGTARGARIDVGEPLEPLGGGHGVRAAEAALDAVVVTGLLPTTPDEVAELYAEVSGDDHPALLLARGPGDVPAAVLWSAVDLHRVPAEHAARWIREHQGATVIEGTADAPATLADPGLLAREVFDGSVLERRLAYLRGTGSWPRSGAVVVVQLDARHADAVADVAEALGRLATPDVELTVVLAELHPPAGDAEVLHALRKALPVSVTVLPVASGLDDLVAALAAADAVVSSSPTALAVARAFERPTVAVDLHGDARLARWGDRARSVAELHERVGALSRTLRTGVTTTPVDVETTAARAALQEHFDALAARLGTAVAERRSRDGEPQPAVGLAERLAALEASHAAVRAATNRERAALAFLEPKQDALPRTMAALQGELDALRNSRTMRMTAPARSVYSRLRAMRAARR